MNYPTAVAGAFLGLIAMTAPVLAAESGPGHQHKSFAGKASYYWEGPIVASGAKFDPTKLTAAHRTLPFGTRVRVTEPTSGRTVVVVINDRGPFKTERVLDLSLAAAKILGMIDRGVVLVNAEVM